MQNRMRSIFLAIFAMTLLALPASVFAQQQTYCLDLNEADCELYTDLASQAAVPESSAFELAIDGTLAGAMPEAIPFSIDLSGAYATDTSALEAAVTELEDVTLIDFSFGDLLELMRGGLASFDAELTLGFELPPEMGVPPIGPFDLWLVDGGAYLDLTPLGAMMGDPSMEGVFGFDVIDLVEVPLQSVTIGDLAEALDGMDAMFDPMMMGDMGMDSNQPNPFDQMILFLPEEEVAKFVSVARLEDETVNGVDVVVFQTDIDIDGVFAVEEIRQQALANVSADDMPEGVTADELLDAVAAAVDGSTMTIVERIDPVTGYGMSATVDFFFTLDLAPFSEIEGIDEEETQMPPIIVDMTMEFTRSDVDAVESIDLPEGAELVPVEALLGGF